MPSTTVTSVLNVQLELTNYCNLRCPYCCSGFRTASYLEDVAHTHRRVDTRVALKLADQAAAFGCRYASFIGYGEPTVHPEWLTITEGFLRAGIRTSIITNLAGPFTREELTALAKMHILWVSIDSPDADVFAALRRGHTLDRFLAALDGVVGEARGAGTQPVIVANAVLCDRTVFSLDRLYSLLLAHGVRTLTLLPLGRADASRTLTTPSGEAIRCLDELDAKEAIEARRCIGSIRERSRSEPLRVQVQPSVEMQLRGSFDAEPSAAAPLSSDLRCCARIFDTLYVDCSGNLLLCNAESIRSGKSAGHLGDESIETLFNGPMFRSFRRQALKGTLPTGCILCCQYQPYNSLGDFERVVAPRLQPRTPA